MDLFGLCQHLQEAGWDAYASDLIGEIAARRTHPAGRGICNLVIDSRGRWRFTATREIVPGQRQDLVRSGRSFHLQQEQQEVLTVAGKLHTQAELSEVLADLTQLAVEAGNPTAITTTEGSDPWHAGREAKSKNKM
ncbi:MAG: hypothetical protein ABTQ73_09205 [Caldilineales bacterium]